MLSRLADKTGHHFLVTGLVKGDFQLVTIDMHRIGIEGSKIRVIESQSPGADGW